MEPCPTGPPAFGAVTVAPNESTITGEVVRVGPAPGGVGGVWEVVVARSDDVSGFANLARRHVGRTISVFVHPGFKGRVREGDTIRATVLFQGGPSGGTFFLKGNQVQTER